MTNGATTTHLPLGKKPATYDHRDLKYTDFRPASAVIALPAHWGHGLDFGQAGWGMMGNGPDDDGSIPPEWTAALQGAGNCTIADAAHSTRQAAHEGGRPIPPITGRTCIENYIEVTGLMNGTAYDPVSGSGDTGLMIRDVLNWRQKTGFKDSSGVRHQIGKYFSIEVGNWQHLREVSYMTESISLGFNVTQSFEDQFNAGQDIVVVPGMMSNVLGGHDIVIAGHPGGGWWAGLSWAQRKSISYAYLLATSDEWWGYIDFARYGQLTGKTAEGYVDQDLELLVSQFVSGQTGPMLH